MSENYLRIPFRYFKKNKGVSILNILGLTLSYAVCVLISLYVVDELSYDRYNERAERIFRINFHAYPSTFNRY